MISILPVPKINIQNNSVAIVGWEEGSAGQIHSWLEKSKRYHIACFINPSDQVINIDPKLYKRDCKQFSYPNKNTFKNKPLFHAKNWISLLKKLNIEN